MLESVLAILAAYLLGSVSGSLVLGRLRQVDIREQGSGNAGGTNALRTQGFWFALGVVIDRRLAGVTAPPDGLYFMGVRYPETFVIPNPPSAFP